MSTADEKLCLELNSGHDASKTDFCGYNGSVIIITKPGGQTLTANPGNWVVILPDGSLDVRADADFCSNFCPATS